MEKLFNMNCFDFMQSQNFLDLIKQRKVVIVTDPPFNINYHYKTYKDNMTEEEYYSMLDDLLSMYHLPFVVIHYPEALYKLSFQIGMFPERVVSWVYNSNTGRQHRDIAFFGIRPNFKQVLQPYKNLADKRIKDRIAKGIGGGSYMTGGILTKLKMFQKKKLLTHVLCH